MPVQMPRDWVRVRRAYAAPGVHGAGLAPRLAHRCEPFAGSLDDWHLHAADLDAARPGYDLEDDDCFDIGGRDTVYRRFGHTLGSVVVVSDQWLWVVEGTGHQLLGTVAADAYEDYCDVFESVADTFDPGRGASSRSA